MIPQPLVPASLIPFLDPWLWWAVALVAATAGLVLCLRAPALRRHAGFLGRVAVGLAGMGVLVELQRRGGIGAPVRSWPGLLLWAVAIGAMAHLAVGLVGRAVRFVRTPASPDSKEPHP